VVLRIGKLKYLTGKGAVISLLRQKYNTASHFAVDIIKSLMSKSTAIKLADRDDENPQHISAEFGNLEARNYI
jgi:hypothetical protein